MVQDNTSSYGTAFTITIEASTGVTTGVSAKDRLTTIKTAIKDGAVPSDLSHPGHVFPLCARNGGVLERDGHTEASVAFGLTHNMTVVSILDIVAYRKAKNL